jgi:hypothetical protein
MIALFISICAFAWQQPVELASLRYVDITQGTGAPAAAGKRFTVHYTGYLKDGTKFDSSVDRNEPFTFIQGRRQVITGWEIGFEGMKVGGKRKLFIPYQLAYGESGSGPIPPKAELTFDVELLDVGDVPDVPAGIDALLPYIDLEARVIALAKSLPEDKFPKPLARIFMHIANANQSFLNAALSDDGVLEELTADSEPGGKPQIVELLTNTFAAVRQQLEASRGGFLSRDAMYFGKPTTRRGLFAALDTLIAEQLGEATAAAR